VQSDEREFRIRPQKPKAKRSERPQRTWASGFKIVMHYARSSRRLRAKGAAGGGKVPSRFRQRCAVRVTYSPNRASGQWRAHGRYIERESATQRPEAGRGFSAASDAVDVGATLEKWQAAGDPRVFKVILSPEFGERIDMQALTRELATQMEIDLQKKLEWCAVEHFNTEHPHVHLALRGVSGGEPLRIKPAYIKSGIREAAENLCTVQLGHRTEMDAIEAERREVTAQRFTSLDRIIFRSASPAAPGEKFFQFSPATAAPSAQSFARARQVHVAERLAYLQKMGLAEPMDDGNWQVRRNLASILRAMQRAQDRQRVLQANGALISDERLPMVVTNLRNQPALEGRVLTHGEEDSGRQYMLLEGTDAQVHFIYHTPEMAAARSQGKLRANSFVRFQRIFGDDGRPIVETIDMGDADRLLKNTAHFRERASGAAPGPLTAGGPWSGWLGRYSAAVADAVNRDELRPPRRPQRRER
jgi:type IV secretory pathway VirD2 relaxase